MSIVNITVDVVIVVVVGIILASRALRVSGLEITMGKTSNLRIGAAPQKAAKLRRRHYYGHNWPRGLAVVCPHKNRS